MVTHERTQPVAVWRPPAPTAVRTVTAALLLGSSVAAASYVALALADAPLAEPAAVLAGLCGALPRVGAVLAGLICVALIGPPSLELLAAALVAGTDLLHRRVLQPRLYAAAGALSPAVAAASLLFAAAFAGMPGAVVVLPVVAAVKAAVLRRQAERA
jgi:putative heme transporter